MMKRVLYTILLTLTSAVSFAQLHMSAALQTNHLWRGGEVADGMVITSDASIKLLNDKFQLGVWGGMNTQGTYKEFNYFATYSVGRFTASLWDTYNFSEYATYNNEDFFDYKAHSTGRFLDATLAYQSGKAFPIKLSWSTIIYGRDRNSDNSANVYSSFCYAEYPIYDKDRWRVVAGAGAAFALRMHGERVNFYGDDTGIVQISMVITHEVTIAGYDIPISVTTMMNPQSNEAYFQLAAQLFSF